MTYYDHAIAITYGLDRWGQGTTGKHGESDMPGPAFIPATTVTKKLSGLRQILAALKPRKQNTSKIRKPLTR